MSKHHSKMYFKIGLFIYMYRNHIHNMLVCFIIFIKKYYIEHNFITLTTKSYTKLVKY